MQFTSREQDTEFPKLSEYGLIGDGRTAALISKYGSIEWLCLPHFDSNSFFGSILDRKKGGYFAVHPIESYESRQFYLDESNVLVTEFTTRAGKARVFDCFSVTTEENKKSQLWPEHEILRIVEVLEGQVEFVANFAPRFAFGQKEIRFERRGTVGFAASVGERLLYLQSSLATENFKFKNSNGISVRFSGRRDQQFVFSLAFAETAPAVLPALATTSERFDLTVTYWKKWIAKCRYEGPYKKEVRRSALALKLLLFAPSGAIIAAATSSLPEKIGGSRNWDYRYCWLRDAAFTIRALVELGYSEEASAFSSWMLHATQLTRPRLQVLYSVFGHAKIKERILPSVFGYRGARPVRIGNAAYNQFQLDVYGEVLDALSIVLTGSSIDRETRRFIIGLGEVVCSHWQEPDDGIWEIRSGKNQHTHSKVLAWVALDRLLKLCQVHNWNAPVEKFKRTRDEIRSAIESKGYNENIGAYVRTFGGSQLDASLLVLPLVGFCSANSSRMRSTIAAIEKSLAREELVYRYRDVDDGVEGSEGTFGICSFWLMECIAKAGNSLRARELFHRFVQRGNAVALWSEEIDPATGDFLGNYPQAFSHVGLINCALTLFRGASA